MYYVITPFGGWINGGIRTVLTATGEKGALMYAMGIAAATAIDLGGPINKAAGFVAFSFTTDHVLPVTARSIAIVIPPIGLGLATIIDRRLTGKRLFNAQLYPQGKTAMFLAFMGISEGAIPFALYGRRYCRLNRRCLAGRSAMVPGVRYLGMAAGH